MLVESYRVSGALELLSEALAQSPEDLCKKLLQFLLKLR